MENSRNISQYRDLIYFVNLIFVFILLLPFASFFYPFIMGDNFFQANSIKESVLASLLYKLAFEFAPIAVISIWLFLNEPKRYSRKFAFQKLNDLKPEALTKIRSWVGNYTKKNIDLFCYEDNKIGAFVFGTWNNLSLSISNSALETLDEKKLHALTLHELSHVINGDLWKTTIARNATFVYMLLYIGGQILTLPIQFQMYKGNFWFIPAISTVISLIPIIVMWLGVYSMIRLGEKIADAFAVSEMGDPTYLASLFFLQSTIKTTGESSNKKNDRWGWLGYHPSVNERLDSIKNQNYLSSEGNFLAVFSGLAASVLIGATTDLNTEIIYMIPVLLLSGSLITFYIERHTDILGYTGLRGLLRNIMLLIFFCSSASVTFFLMTISWLFLSTSNPLTSDPIPQVVIEFPSKLYLIHRLWVLTDLMLVVSFILPIVFISLLGVKNSLANVLNINFHSITISNITVWLWLSFLPFLVTLCVTWITFIKSFEVAWFLPWSILGSLFICIIFMFFISIKTQSTRA